MNKSDLDLDKECARVLDMCEGTAVDPTCCWKFCGKTHEKYKFAIAILEGKPVFVGDTLYHKLHGRPIYVTKAGFYDNYSWNPPKKTFSLNGVELPCPDGNKGGYQISLLNGRHYFSDFHDAQKVANAFDKLLTENTK